MSSILLKLLNFFIVILDKVVGKWFINIVWRILCLLNLEVIDNFNVDTDENFEDIKHLVLLHMKMIFLQVLLKRNRKNKNC